MQGAADTARIAAIVLVNRATRRTGTRSAAYRDVARKIGATHHWLRKYISSPSAPEPRVTVWFNIIRLYRHTCERVEEAAERERLLGERIDAIAKSVGPLRDRVVAHTKEGQAAQP